jgi:Zn-dependent protease with chaperone function
MVAGLKRLQAMYGREVGDEGSPALAAFKISGRASFLGLFSTHPPLEERIRRLELGNDPRDYQGSARKA